MERQRPDITANVLPKTFGRPRTGEAAVTAFLNQQQRVDRAVHDHLVDGFERTERALQGGLTPAMAREARRDRVLLEAMAMGRGMNAQALAREAHERVIAKEEDDTPSDDR